MRVAPAEEGMELTERQHIATEGNTQTTQETECQQAEDAKDSGDRRPKTVKLHRAKSAYAGIASPSTFINSGHVHYSASNRAVDQTPRFRRPNFGMTQIIPTVCLIVIIIAIVASLSILLPAQLGLQMTSANGSSKANVQKRSGQIHHLNPICNKEPPSPVCLVWDWKQGSYEVGTIINYWCATTTSFTVYATVECMSNRTWTVTSFTRDLPCNCKVDWLH